jgi:hypothetical protein
MTVLRTEFSAIKGRETRFFCTPTPDLPGFEAKKRPEIDSLKPNQDLIAAIPSHQFDATESPNQYPGRQQVPLTCAKYQHHYRFDITVSFCHALAQNGGSH